MLKTPGPVGERWRRWAPTAVMGHYTHYTAEESEREFVLGLVAGYGGMMLVCRKHVVEYSNSGNLSAVEGREIAVHLMNHPPPHSSSPPMAG